MMLDANDPNFSARYPHRDPLLPPPDVCDWLLEQEWSGVIPETFITYPKGGAEVIDSTRFDHCSAGIEIGADERGHFDLPIEALEVLKADREARREAIEQKRAEMEPDELERKRQREGDRVDEARGADSPDPDQPLPRGGIVLNSEDTGSLLLDAILTLREIANLEQGGVNGRSWCRSTVAETERIRFAAAIRRLDAVLKARAAIHSPRE